MEVQPWSLCSPLRDVSRVFLVMPKKLAKQSTHILFVGGGSLGPVTPLLATVKALKRREPNLITTWIGTSMGPERSFVERAGISFFSLPTAKWPRHPSWAWVVFPLRLLKTLYVASCLMKRLKPDAIVSVGGFTAWPITKVAVRRGIPCFTHQLDVEPGLTNRLIASSCKSVTTSFEYERGPFGDTVTDSPIATPVRYERKNIPNRVKAVHAFGLDPIRPVVFIYGGGQGAAAINAFVRRTLQDWLTWTQVIHVTGEGKEGEKRSQKGYIVRTLLKEEEMFYAHAAADLEICRGGIGSLAEVAALKKAAIVIPIPGSHQEANAKAFEEQGAVMVVSQTEPSFDQTLIDTARRLMQNKEACKAMGERAHSFFKTDDGSGFAERILTFLQTSL